MGDVCEDCPAGTISIPGSTECFEVRGGEWIDNGAVAACPVGYYCTGDGKRVECPGGSYSDKIGSSACTPCPAGSTAFFARSSACVPCAAGTVNPSTGSVFCFACPAGTFSANPGGTTCTACAGGTTSPEGSAKCDPIPVGVGDRAIQGVRFVYPGGDLVLPALEDMSGAWRLLDAQGQTVRTGAMPGSGRTVDLGTLGAGRWILKAGDHQVSFSVSGLPRR